MQTCSEVVLLVYLKISFVLGSDGLGTGMTPQYSLKAVGMFIRYVLDRFFFSPVTCNRAISCRRSGIMRQSPIKIACKVSVQ